MTGATAPVQSENSGGNGGAGGGAGWTAPRNWRVSTKLNAILLIPLVVGLVVGGFQVRSSVDTWQEAQDAERVALVVRAASGYTQALFNERDLSAQPLLSNKRDSTVVTDAYAATDAAARKFDAAVKNLPRTQRLIRRLQLFHKEEPKLAGIRRTAYAEALDPVKTEEGYVSVQHSLTEFSNELRLGTGNITSYGHTVYTIQQAKAAESLQRSIGMHLLIRPSQDATKFRAQAVAFNAYNYLEQIAIGEYNSGGTQADSDTLKTVMAGKAAEGQKQLAAAKKQAQAAGRPFAAPPSKAGSVFEGMAAEIGKGRTPDDLMRKGITPQSWMAASTATFDGYTEIETGLVNKAVAEAESISHNAENNAITNAAIVLAALLVAVVLAHMMARQMSRALCELRTAAFGIAEQQLPMMVDQLSRTEPGRVDTRLQPIPVHTQDEIGEVARAFDQVHREAVRLAAEQAMLRGNVNAIFTNLSRRNQSLIEGQLTLITDLENNEADPDQLAGLFRLDHLATRIRRNGENLLVLAGEEPGRRWKQPVALVDVLRAASSEVESHERIELTGVPETEIHGRAVADVVHLLAELLENATTFSSPQTKVRLTATRLPDSRVVIEIHDKGIGLTAEDFADINHKLANPPTVDAVFSQRMGLFVVGRLADRHGVRVQLRPSGEAAGTTSLVMLPAAITHGAGGEPRPAEDFTVSSIIPEQASFQTAPLHTAAELGFDDTRYGDAEPSELDPVNRSLIREERRAVLGAQASASEPPPFRHQLPSGGQPYGQDAYAPGDYLPEQYQQPQQDAYVQAQQPPRASYEQGRYATPDDQPGTDYPDSGFPAVESRQTQRGNGFNSRAPQDDWQGPATHQDGCETAYRPETEPPRGAPAGASKRVGFDRAGPSPSTSDELTNAGLPRRGGAPQTPQPEPAEQNINGSSNGNIGGNSGTNSGGPDDSRSSNDERWQRAGKLREPKAGGVTLSGLPRRVPKANLVEGKAETLQGGPQVSRAPEDVQGSLGNPRQGVLRRRNAGSDTNGQADGNHHSDPDSTYNQEH
jgi:signal transduction histidine kinase